MSPYRLEDVLELRVPDGEWCRFRQFVERYHVAGNVEVRLLGGAEDANGFPVLELPPHVDVVRFEPGRPLRLVVLREGSEPARLPPLFAPGHEPRGIVAPVVAYGVLGVAVGLALAGEAWDAYRRWRRGESST